MNVTDLDPAQRTLLVHLAAQLVRADGSVSSEEVQELLELGDEMEHEKLLAEAAEAQQRSRREVLAEVAGITDPAVRDLYRTVLHDLAQVDGLDAEEAKLIRALDRIWGTTEG